jgi:hypothetical protein
MMGFTLSGSEEIAREPLGQMLTAQSITSSACPYFFFENNPRSSNENRNIINCFSVISD